MFETMKRNKKRTFYKVYVKFESYFESFNRETQKSSFFNVDKEELFETLV